MTFHENYNTPAILKAIAQIVLIGAAVWMMI